MVLELEDVRRVKQEKLNEINSKYCHLLKKKQIL